MPRLFLPNIAAGVIPKDVSYRPLTSKPLFPQESQSLQGLVARKRMLFPVFHTLPHFGIHLLVVIVQNYLHSLQYLCFAMQRYEEKTERQNIPIIILSKSACVIILFSFVYSIGRIIGSMNWESMQCNNAISECKMMLASIMPSVGIIDEVNFAIIKIHSLLYNSSSDCPASLIQCSHPLVLRPEQ